MDDIAKAIAQNHYLQSLAILIAVITALVSIWKSRAAIIDAFKVTWSFLNRKVFTPSAVIRKHTELGANSSSYLLAVLVSHVLTLFWISLIWYLLFKTLGAMDELKGASSYLQITFRVCLIVMTALFGIRLGELKALMSRIKEHIEDVHQ